MYSLPVCVWYRVKTSIVDLHSMSFRRFSSTARSVESYVTVGKERRYDVTRCEISEKKNWAVRMLCADLDTDAVPG